MNRINPLYIGLFLIVVLMSVSYKLSSIKSELSEAKEAYKETSQLAIQLNGLKSVYTDKKGFQKSIQRVLSNAALQSAELQQEIKKSGITIISLSMDINALNFLMGKILNGTYNVSSLKIKRLSDTKVSLDMEIKW